MSLPKKIQVEFASRYRDLKLLKRRWFPLWTLDGYVLKEFFIKYSILMLVFIVLFILSDIYRDISDFIDAGASIRDVGLYLLLRLPGNIRFIMPISMLLGCMWTMATFGKNLEVTAMRASGVSLMRCGGAIFAFGLAITALNVYFNESLIPWTSVAAEKIYDQAADKREYAKSLLTYKSDDGERRWLFQLFIGGEDQKNVTLKTVWSAEMIHKLIGHDGTPEFDANMEKIFGERYKDFPSEMQQRRRRLALMLEGRKIDFHIDVAKYDENLRAWIFESGEFVSYDRMEETSRKESQGTIQMHNPIRWHKPLVFSSSEIKESPRDILNAVQEKDNLATPEILHVLRNNPNMPEKSRCIYETVLYYRLAFPWSCFLAVFLGIPLATRNERTGSMLAIISAIALIVIYIVVAQMFLMLGKSGALNPMVCGLAPTVAFIVAGAIKIMHDRV